MGKQRTEFTASYTSIRPDVFEQTVPEENGNQKCMGEAQLKSDQLSKRESEEHLPFHGRCTLLETRISPHQQ